MLFDNWDGVFRVVIVGLLAYAGLVVILRASGNRTLSKMNSFDLIVTIALGSTLSTILINSNVSLAEGMTALALLVLLQYLVTWLQVRSSLVNRTVKTSPTLLLKDGRFLEKAMNAVRVTEDEIRGAVRQHGFGGVEQVAAVVMETDGSLSVVGSQNRGSLDALHGVEDVSRK